MSTKLSINVNKIATLRNSRGGNNPDVLAWVSAIQRFGADGITVHPRPDERHIRYQDVIDMKELITTEFNIEGNPKEEKFVQLVLETKPHQVTLVPDDPNQLTSNHGWDTIKELKYLQNIIPIFQKEGIRVSIFLDAIVERVNAAFDTGTDRIELYTEDYARQYKQGPESAIATYIEAAQKASDLGIGVNAGHDLDLENLNYFVRNIPNLLEVSIGHAVISDALTYGMQNTVQLYKRAIDTLN